jgi:sugar-specific transcriptional regulator TrmB
MLNSLTFILMKLDKTLQNYGLSVKESQLYIALLELGKSTILDLSKATKIKRAGLYYTIKTLIEKGLASEIMEGKKRYWTATDPDTLLTREEEKRSLLSLAMPELRTINNAASNKPRITYYQGSEGIKRIDSELIVNYAKTLPLDQREALEYANPKDILLGKLVTSPKDATNNRIINKVRLRIIAPRTEFNEKLAQDNNPNSLRELRLSTDLELNNTIYYIIGNRIVLYFLDKDENPGAIMIEDAKQAELQRFIFNQLWETLK